MKKIRIGNTLRITWDIFIGEDGEVNPYDLTDKNISVYLINAFSRDKIENFTTEGNTLRFTWEGKDQRYVGVYQITIIENEGKKEMHTLDECNIFELVRCTCMEDDDENGVVDIDLSSKLEALQVYPIIPVIGENGNWWVDGVDTGNPTRGEKGDVVDASYMEFDVDDDMNLNLTFISTNDQLSLDFEIDENGYLTVDK